MCVNAVCSAGSSHFNLVELVIDHPWWNLLIQLSVGLQCNVSRTFWLTVKVESRLHGSVHPAKLQFLLENCLNKLIGLPDGYPVVLSQTLPKNHPHSPKVGTNCTQILNCELLTTVFAGRPLSSHHQIPRHFKGT